MLHSEVTFWELWHPRLTMLVNIVLHFVLTILGIFRKSNYSQTQKLVTWFCYNAVDLVSYASIVFPFAIRSATDHHLIALWSVFSIMFIGGNDTITTLSIEDNRLWRRFTVIVIAKVFMYVTVIVQCFSEGIYHKFGLMIIFIFLCGLYNCGERILAHKWGNLDELRSTLRSQGREAVKQDFASIRDGLIDSERSGIPAIVLKEDRPSQQLPVYLSPRSFSDQECKIQSLIIAHSFYRMSGGPYADKRYNSEDRRSCRSLFSSMPSDMVFQIAKKKIVFMHEEIHSKALLSHTKVGLISRLISLLVITCSCIFIVGFQELSFPGADKCVTYLLFFLDITIRWLMLFLLVFSHRNVVGIMNSGCSIRGWFAWVALKIFPLEDPKLSMGQIDFFDCLNIQQPSCFKRLMYFIFTKEEWENYIHGRQVCVSHDFENIIWSVLNKKSREAEDTKNFLFSTMSRGEWALKEAGCYPKLGWSVEKEFCESALIWAIATTLVYNDFQGLVHPENLKIAKCFSDYFLHLLRKKPILMSSLALDLIKISVDTFTDLEIFLQYQEPNLNDKQKISELLMSQNIDFDFREVMGDDDRSVLWYGIKLARELLEFSLEDTELILNHMWVDMLSYAAICYPREYHAELLAEGVELLSIIRFITVQLGLGDQYKADSGPAFIATVSM